MPLYAQLPLEATEEMALAGAKMIAEQLHYKNNAWDRCVDDDCKSDYLNAAKWAYQTMTKLAFTTNQK